MDREYVPITMRSKYPDSFQSTHQELSYIDSTLIDTIQVSHLMPTEEKVESPLSTVPTQPSTTEAPVVQKIPEEKEFEPVSNDLMEKTVHIKEGESGYSYKKLFGSYLKGAAEIRLSDPYIRLEFQIHNLITFIDIIDTMDGSVKLHLVTTAVDNEQEVVNSAKFEEIATNAAQHGITFTYEYSSTLHRRGIEADNGWKIIIDRGLDLFQKPASHYELSEVDQTKRKCRETEILYVQED